MPELPPGEYASVGGEIDRVRVAVRATGQDLDPDDVTRLLGVEPTIALRRGDLRRSGSAMVVQGTGVWSFEFAGAPEEWTLDEAIVALLARLPTDLSIWDRLADRYALDLFCGLFLDDLNRGFVVRPLVLKQLADRHLKLDVDIYYVARRPGRAI